MTHWILIIWFATPIGNVPHNYGEFFDKDQCEKVFSTINSYNSQFKGPRLAHHLCLDRYSYEN